MKLKYLKAEVNSTTIVVILGMLIGLLIIVFFTKTNSGFLAKSTGMFKALGDCGKCIPQYGLFKCLPLCWIL